MQKAPRPMRLRAKIFLCAGLWLAASPALALTLEAPLKDAATEARAKALFHEVRCVVCQGESIADSPADVASDLRRDIRERLVAGENEEAIKEMLVEHYGGQILMKPPVTPATWLLWAGPALVLAAALGLARRYFKRGRVAA